MFEDLIGKRVKVVYNDVGNIKVNRGTLTSADSLFIELELMDKKKAIISLKCIQRVSQEG